MAKKLYVRNAANNAWVEIGTSVPNIENYLTQSSASLTYATIAYVDSEISNLDLTPYATKIYADAAAVSASAAAVTYLIDAAPESLNTLNELAAALNDDANFAGTVTTALAGKLDISSASTTYATKTELQELDLLPSQTGNDGKYLTTTGASAYWGDLNIPPSAVLQSASPVGAEAGQIWVDSNASASYLNTNDFLLKADVPYTPVYIMNSGTTEQRPTGSSGAFRYNSTLSRPEWYEPVSGNWLPFSYGGNIQLDYLLVSGGGGGGGYYSGGGGGGGGVLTGTYTINSGTSYSISIGGGGTGGGTGANTLATSGTNSTFASFTAVGGGRGGNGGLAPGQSNRNGGSGGSGGGGGGDTSGGIGGSGTAGQGYAGGDGTSSANYRGGGGGGAGAIGASGVTSGNGGIGVESSITGSSTYYSGGGGGGTQGGVNGVGGNGGGGNASNPGTAGTANTGGGGGGTTGGEGFGGNGGSGVLVLSYPDSFPVLTVSAGLTYTQPTRTGYRVYRFTAGTGTVSF